MSALIAALAIVVLFALLGLSMSFRVVHQYQEGVLFRLGRVVEVRETGAGNVQLRPLQSLVEIGVDKNTRVVFPAPLMSTIEELGAFIGREARAAGSAPAPTAPRAATNGAGPVGGASTSNGTGGLS